VGGGFIGLELAAAGIQRGCEVTVVEIADRLLARAMPGSISERVHKIHRDRGVDFVFSDSVAGFEGGERVASVRLTSGKVLPADLVVVGIGLIAETRIAAQAGLDVDDGILANEFCQSSAPDIYAIGDCARAYNLHYQRHMRLESWQNAEQQADIAARHICGDPVGWKSVPWFWTDQYEFNIQMAGSPRAGSELVSRGSLDDGGEMSFCIDHGEITGAVAVGKGTAMAKDLRIAQMLIEGHRPANAAQLADPKISLKTLLKG
jgi:NADPH-dependent 2,4-dienoyl-CoA reductase/sulfur reductase-like enzyme